MTSTPYTEDTLVQQTIAEKKFEDSSVKGKVWDRICRNERLNLPGARKAEPTTGYGWIERMKLKKNVTKGLPY